MNAPIYIKETNSPSQPFFYNDVKIKKSDNEKSTLADGSSAVHNEEEWRAAKGIVYALIICIPFWLLFIMFVGWLVKY